MFISLDGFDGVGKSTQLQLLGEWLTAAGHDVVTCRDPGSTPLGERIRDILLDDSGDVPIDARSEMLLYMAARAQLVSDVIGPALQAKRTVVSDRYLLANIVYQGHAGGLDVEEIRRVGGVATGGLLPDLTIVLDMPPAAANARMQRPLDRMEQRGDDYRQKLRDGFLAEAERDPERIAVIDAARPIDQVHVDVRAAVEAAL